VQLVGKFPFLQTGGQNDDGHYLRRIATDGWLGCSGLAFTDSDNWGMGGGDIMASNVAADGFPDEIIGTFRIPVTRVDASDMTSAAGNFSSGFLSGQPYQPAISEGYWLRCYLTNVWQYQTRQWTNSETAYVDNGGSAWATGAASVQAANSSLTWTAGGSSTAGGTYKIVHDANTIDLWSPNFIDGSGNPLMALWIITSKSFEMEVWDGQRHPLRRLFPGVINQPFSLVASWCLGSIADPYFRTRTANVTVFDVIRSSAASFGGVSFKYNVYGWGTLMIDQPTATPSGQATAATLTITE